MIRSKVLSYFYTAVQDIASLYQKAPKGCVTHYSSSRLTKEKQSSFNFREDLFRFFLSRKVTCSTIIPSCHRCIRFLSNIPNNYDTMMSPPRLRVTSCFDYSLSNKPATIIAVTCNMKRRRPEWRLLVCICPSM